MTSSIFMSSNIFYNFVFIYIKMSKDLSAKYYQSNKERLREKACERYQSLSKDQKEKSNNMVVNDTKIGEKIKSKSLLSIEENALLYL